MRRIRSVHINYIIIGFAIVSFYAILAIKLIPLLRVPGLFPDVDYEEVNDIIVDFSVAYLSGCLLYVLTVVIKEYIRRSQQRWIAYDALNGTNNYLHEIQSSCGIDKMITEEEVIPFVYDQGERRVKDYDKLANIAEECHKNIHRIVLSGLLLRDAEIDCLMEIDNICVYLYKDFVNNNLEEKKLKTFAESILKLGELSNTLTKHACSRIEMTHLS